MEQFMLQSVEILREDKNIAIWTPVSYFIFYKITYVPTMSTVSL